ncbi:CRISPR-associated endonuclease Cas2 [Telmatospirillum sp. J64-1]|uniref:CRISPR-associated endonuclease Cas2 n=1 Tax=Telmatospirillum sp. J64-1 TaxID=2502183 RepID=UPI00115E0F80|nr:CRISPR-associated endonuclease Cas2 [Telmatospirillum sp. J64-1]
MFVIVTYDVNAKRTQKYRKLLIKYLGHEQFSVFFGDITKSQLDKLRREMNKLVVEGDRVLEFLVENRHNIDISLWSKTGHSTGLPSKEADDRHKRDSRIL